MASIREDGLAEGDYVKVTKAPDPWEGGIEEDADRNAYVGHIGVVVENEEIDECMYALVRFPSPFLMDVGQRMIEWSALELLGHPEYNLPEDCF